jgi:serine/threonine protein kinase
MTTRAEHARTKGKRIGSGAYRTVYKAKNGKYVYKFNTSNYGIKDVGSNYHEYQTYQRLQNVTLPAGVRIPKMKYIDGVIVAEYIKGHEPRYWCNWGWHSCGDEANCYATKMGKDFPIRDIKPDNLRITADGTIYVIDLGNGSSFD